MHNYVACYRPRTQGRHLSLIYTKQLLDEVFRNNHGRVKCYQPSRRPRLINLLINHALREQPTDKSVTYDVNAIASVYQRDQA